LPAAIRAEDFPVAAKFAERWLNGRRFDAHRYDYEKEKMVEGRYDADMVDSGTIKLRWLFKFGRIRERYDELLRKLDKGTAKGALRKNLTTFLQTQPNFTGILNTLEQCRGDLQKLHSDFQYQYVGVGMQDTMAAAPAERGSWLPIGMTDASAALGRFNFYATIARAEIYRESVYRRDAAAASTPCVRTVATVTHVHLYMRDSYSFHDSHRSSQYLGHWNKKGMIVLPAAAVASFLSSLSKEGSRFDIRTEPDDMKLLPVVIKNWLETDYVYYPLRNRDFRAWQAKHNRGGDFMIYSDFSTIRLAEPLHLELESQC